MSTAATELGDLWHAEGFPHRGWECTHVEDLNPDELPADEVEYETCQACGQHPIRFVHTIVHDDWPDEVDVGRICVEHLTGDYVNPARREAELKRRAAGVKRQREAYERGRAKWAARSWRESAKGNLWTRHEGLGVTVFRFGSGWRIVVDGVFGRKTYASQHEAQQASYDAVSWVKKARAKELKARAKEFAEATA
jgi:hypothetical protein